MKKAFSIILLLYSVAASAQSRQYAPYVPSVDVNIYRQALERASSDYERLADARARKIQTMARQSLDLINGMQNETMQKKILKQYNDFALNLNEGEYNYMDDATYSWILKCFTTIQRNAFKYDQ